ncbi:putative translation initiation factor eIF-2B subunit gamma [Leucoagaricus sp. SymC.cos]|nr:putative translation initiation factor eIF-2B subunit gamma [Leucoagaricus sp. SymC.cos]
MDLESVKTELVSREFLAVVLAGFGNELQPLTGDYGDEPSPKALLPVANRPMIEYLLLWIEQSGIKDVLLICPTIHRLAIYHHIHSDISSSSLNVDLQTYDETVDSSTGTCTLLRHFVHRIQEDFVLLSCDFIAPPSLPLSTLLNQFRADSGSNGAIATTCWYATSKPEKAASPEEWGLSAPPASIVWDDASGTLLHIDTADDLDRNPGELELRMSLLSRYPRVRLSTNFRDSHVYVCRHSVLDALAQKVHMESFKEEFLPWLCKVQYQKLKRRKYDHILYTDTYVQTSQSTALQHSTLLTIANNDNVLSLVSNGEGELSASLKVGVVLHHSDAGFAIRVRDLNSFVEINRRVLSTTSYTLPIDPKNRALIDQKAQISPDTIIGDSTKVSERTAIKKSIIGRHCIIGKMVKIVGCILLDHCVIEDGAKIEGSVLGKNTKIGAKAEMSRCVTQAGYEVSAGDIVKNEKLEATDWTAASDLTESEDGGQTSESEKGSDV